MRALRVGNAVLALVTELLLLAAAVAVPLASALPLAARIVLAVLLPLAVLAVWARWVAPRALRRLDPGGRLLLTALLFALGVLGLAVTGLPIPALVLAVLAAVRLGLGARLGDV